MAVGNDSLGALHPVPGLRLATVSAGIKKPGRRDLVLMELAPGTEAAAVFTRNAFCAAPVTVAREHLQACAGQPRYLLVNTGNANAGTGEPGIVAADACVEAVALAAGADPAGDPAPKTLISGDGCERIRISNHPQPAQTPATRTTKRPVLVR